MTGLRGLIMDYAGVLTEGPEMVELARRVRTAGMRTALLTDAAAVPDGCAEPFDEVVLGAALGVRKPAPEVFVRVARLLGLRPADCVMVDDMRANVQGARAAGLVVVRHTDPETTIAEVEILFDLLPP
ncbi:HAD-IA family hydrolase [Actinomycetes bacterium KLBMP 9759]